MTMLQKMETPYPVLKTIVVKTHEIKNERDTKEINNVIKSAKNMLLLGELPGVGKTTIACNYDSKSKLFVCPFNKLCHSLKQKKMDAVTLNMLLGLGFNNDINKKASGLNVAAYDCIIFDEIFLYTPNNLKRINAFMKRHSDKTFIATGDNCQNDPIGIDTLNVENKSLYLRECMSHLFSDQIILKECKRLKKKKDIAIMMDLKKDIFDKKKDVMETIKKYKINVITDMKQLKTKSNICFFNYQCARVNSYVHNNMINRDDKTVIVHNNTEYYKGLELICKKHYKASKCRLFVNYAYDITKISSKYFTINEPVESVSMTLPISMLTTNFKLPYANTNHSVQGLTIEEDFTIFDMNTPYINRNWIWTALTRTDDLKKITVFEHDAATINRLTASKMEQYFRLKIANYVVQDKKAGREIDKENYVTTEWVRQCFFHQNKECCICKSPLEFEITDGSVLSNLTVD
jgi:hypothetical protein